MSGFKWYPGSHEALVPWNAVFEYPDQTNKINKLTPRIPPKNGASFTPGGVIRLELPSQGYLNPLNTSLEFDVVLNAFGTSGNDIVRFQNDINCVFSRGRLMYGANHIEEILNYGVISRLKTEWTGTTQQGSMDQYTISQGIGGVSLGGAYSIGGGSAAVFGYVNTRQFYIQGIDQAINTTGTVTVTTAILPPIVGTGVGNVPNGSSLTGITNTAGTYTGGSGTSQVGYCSRRYQVYFLFGLFNQEKLIPLKWMSSFAIELNVEAADACMFVIKATGSGATPTFGISNVNLIPEILEFDASYDAAFYKGLTTGGVPIKFSTWKTHISTVSGLNTVNVQVQERSRSVKSLFAVQRRSPPDRYTDSHTTFFDTATSAGVGVSGGSTMQSYQYRIAGRYFPAAPVQLSMSAGSVVSNGGGEAYVELEKALGSNSDARLSTNTNVLRWAISPASAAITLGAGSTATCLPELDYSCFLVNSYLTGVSAPTYVQVTKAHATTGNSLSGNVGSCCFTSSVSLEATNGAEISGFNAEEQSDISFMANWSSPQATGFVLEVYALVDAMIVLRENNIVELIQ